MTKLQILYCIHIPGQVQALASEMHFRQKLCEQLSVDGSSISLSQTGQVRAFSIYRREEDIASVVFFPSINRPSSGALLMMRGTEEK